MAIRKIISRSIGVDVIVASDIADGAIGIGEIANDAVTADKLANSVNASIAAKLPLVGGTLTGNLVTAGITSTTLGTSNFVAGANSGNSIASGGNYNVTIGDEAGTAISTGDKNTAVGYEALKTTSTQESNVAVGSYALKNNTANSNTAVGANAMELATSGGSNCAFGEQTLYGVVTGADNSAFGAQSLWKNTSGTRNTAIGRLSCLNTTTGSYNTAVGANSLKANISGSYNCAIGDQSLLSTTTGVENIGIGYNAGTGATGSSNIFIGHVAGDNLGAGNNNMCIGKGTLISGNSGNQEMVISSKGSNVYGKGDNTGFINPNGGAMYNGDNTTVWVVASDERLKKNIVNNDVGLAKINAIQVRNFDYKTVEEVESDGVLDSHQAIVKTGTQLGVIAQELELICPDCVTTESTGVKTVAADNLHWHMLNAIKELSTQNTALAARIQALEDA
jgi:hypothetical protein